ncbi:MAG: GxxExxY protein [Sphingorhabdus sp.]
MIASQYDIEKIISDVIDCGFAIHNRFGPGLLESAYELLLIQMLMKRGYVVERQKAIALRFDNIVIEEAYRVDLLVAGQLIVELKSVEQLAPVHSKQLLTYLRISELPIGLLLNFGQNLFKDGIRRVINNKNPYIAPPKL